MMTTTATRSTQILQRVSNLPPLPAAVGRLLRLVNAPEVEFKEIARTISLDQTLTAQLLRLANSAFYGFPQQIRTVQQATVVLGRHSIRNMALSLAIVRLRSHMRVDGPLDPEEFWRHSIGVACGARLLAQQQRNVQPDEAFVAGLLHDIGKIVLVEYDTTAYEELLGIAAEGIAPLHELERQAFGIDHAAVGQALCAYWNIPEELAATVNAHHRSAAAARTLDGLRSGQTCTSESPGSTEHQTVAIVNLADTLAKICVIGRSGNPHISATWFSDAPTFRDMPERVRQTLEALPSEVACNEAIFFEDDVQSDVENRYVGRLRMVYVCIGASDHDLLVQLVLRARGYEIVTRLDEDHEVDEIDFVVADESLVASDRARCDRADVQVADYAMWRLEQISDEWINMDRLHDWLSESINAQAPAL